MITREYRLLASGMALTLEIPKNDLFLDCLGNDKHQILAISRSLTPRS